ncbi:MAG: hypothetical protein ACRCV7_04340 [Culicoidibacterales bacterium]
MVDIKNSNLKLAQNYSIEEHEKFFFNENEEKLKEMAYLYDEDWKRNDNYPYEIVSFLLDAYFVFPKRPDFSAYFTWQALNNSYNLLQMNSSISGNLTDANGIGQLSDKIQDNYNKYKNSIEKYLERLPIKAFKFVASYLLKGYFIDKSSVYDAQPTQNNYFTKSYKSTIRQIPILKDILEKSYGEKYLEISPRISNTNARYPQISTDNKAKSRKLEHAFAITIRELVVSGKTEIKTINGNLESYIFEKKEKVNFLLFSLLYALRCSNFHGSSASRGNSENNNVSQRKERYDMYTAIFFIEYMVLAISMNIQGMISDDVLKNVEINYKIMSAEENK